MDQPGAVHVSVLSSGRKRDPQSLHDSGHPPLARKGVVRRPSPSTDPTTSGTSMVGPVVTAAPLQQVPQRRPRAEPSRMVTLQCLLPKSGFPRGSAVEMSGCVRTSTSRLYQAKWMLFCGWCCGRGVAPVNATLYVSALRAVVKQICTCKIEYYQHQMSQCDDDQRRTFVLLIILMGRTLDPVMPASSLDDELSSRFNNFFSEKITRIRSETDVAVVNREFSVDFPLRFTRSLTFSHFRLVAEAYVLRYMRETRKTCSLDPINVSKLGEAYESAALAMGAIINSSFDEGHFVASEKRGLIRPYLKKIGLDVNNLSNYRPVTNLTHLSKIIEWSMLDQLVPFLEEVSVVPRYQSAYRKRHSTETALCKIHDGLVSNTCHGKASLLVLLDLSAAFDTVDHQLLLSDFSDCGGEGTALSLLESYLENREQCVAIGESRFELTTLQYGVPQGSVLGPVLFTVYTGTLAFLLEAHGVSYHFFADDTQLYIGVENIDEAKLRLSSLLPDLKIWMAGRKLKLNDGKADYCYSGKP